MVSQTEQLDIASATKAVKKQQFVKKLLDKKAANHHVTTKR